MTDAPNANLVILDQININEFDFQSGITIESDRKVLVPYRGLSSILCFVGLDGAVEEGHSGGLDFDSGISLVEEAWELEERSDGTFVVLFEFSVEYVDFCDCHDCSFDLVCEIGGRSLHYILFTPQLAVPATVSPEASTRVLCQEPLFHKIIARCQKSKDVSL